MEHMFDFPNPRTDPPAGPSVDPPAEQFTDQPAADDLAGMPSERLEAEICSTAAHLAAGTCRFLLLVAEFDRRDGHATWECRSTAHWLNWKCGIGMHAAREQVRVARRLIELPHVRAAFASGRLSFSKVRAISRVAHPGIEADLVRMAEHATAQQMEDSCGALRRCRDLAEAEAELHETEQRTAARSHLTLRHRNDGLVGGLRLTPEDGEILLRAVDLAVRRAAEGRPDNEPTSPIDHERASGLLELARAYLADDRNSTDRNSTDGPHPEIVVHVDLAVIEAARQAGSPPAGHGNPPPHGREQRTGSNGTDINGTDINGTGINSTGINSTGINGTELLDPLHSWRWPVATGSGTHLSFAALARLTSDAGIRWVADLPDGSQLDLGRHRRTPNRQMMRALRSRDGHCRFPGCSSRHRLHAHHIRWWIHGGPTDMDNLILLCAKHHHAVHDREWTCTGTAAAPEFRRPDGRVVAQRPPVCSGTYAELLAAHEQAGLDVCVDAPGGRWGGERIDWDCFFAAFAAPEPVDGWAGG